MAARPDDLVSADIRRFNEGKKPVRKLTLLASAAGLASCCNISSNGFAPIALAMAMYSATSRRRSSVSYFDTNVCRWPMREPICSFTASLREAPPSHPIALAEILSCYPADFVQAADLSSR